MTLSVSLPAVLVCSKTCPLIVLHYTRLTSDILIISALIYDLRQVTSWAHSAIQKQNLVILKLLEGMQHLLAY